MKTIRTLFARALGKARTSFACTLSVAVFIAAAAAVFAAMVRTEDGGPSSIEVLWAAAAAPMLPVLAAFLTMDAIAGERRDGSFDLLLCAPVSERQIVLGKALGAYSVLLAALLLYLAVPLAILPFFSKMPLHAGNFVFAFSALAIQGFLWISAGMLFSAVFKTPATAAAATIIAAAALPYGAYRAASAWLPALRRSVPEFPFSTHASDIASGLVESHVAVFYLAAGIWFLFAASKAVAWIRFNGRTGFVLKLSTSAALTLSAAFAALVVVLASEAPVSIDFSPDTFHAAPSLVRVKSTLLKNSTGSTSICVFMNRSDKRFRDVTRAMRALKAFAKSSALPQPSVTYIDPRWDVAEASNLIRDGVKENSVVVSKQPSGREILPVAVFQTRPDENIYSGAGQSFSGGAASLSGNSASKTIGWISGHGELSPEDGGRLSGLSSIDNVLRQTGFVSKTASLGETFASSVGKFSALIWAAPAKPLSKNEQELLSNHLRSGGRLLVLVPDAISAPEAFESAKTVLSEWGASLENGGQETVFAKPAPGHAVSDAVDAGCIYEMHSPVFLSTNAAAHTSAESGALKISFKPLAKSDKGITAAAIEHGRVSEDISYLRPTRIVAIGSAPFVSNALSPAAFSANASLFSCAAAWLTGTDPSEIPPVSQPALQTGMLPQEHLKFLLTAAGGFPLLLFVLMLAASKRR